MQMLRLFYHQKVWTFSIFICSNHTVKGCPNFLIFSFIPELDAVSCFFFFFHVQRVIQFWELLKNSLGVVKILEVESNFPELIYTVLCLQLHVTAIELFCVPCISITDVPHDITQDFYKRFSKLALSKQNSLSLTRDSLNKNLWSGSSTINRKCAKSSFKRSAVLIATNIVAFASD